MPPCCYDALHRQCMALVLQLSKWGLKNVVRIGDETDQQRASAAAVAEAAQREVQLPSAPEARPTSSILHMQVAHNYS